MESSQSEGFKDSVRWTILLYFGRSLPLCQRSAIVCLLRKFSFQLITLNINTVLYLSRNFVLPFTYITDLPLDIGPNN